ncbi:hypothetical protein [Nitrosopumilus maritimus]|uniref:Uncharacterized protein n=1 Tax=Nitrosopumilus maritimus (strain SCM1) TaxID=436308 RepID=A9A4J2_NITMS|nr:hypothetical protein [Nitrosopumilus maritimus]ABX12970.1 hypothetical protein Nmar_1074 [Nitrosopumilus maritimus SCM1]
MSSKILLLAIVPIVIGVISVSYLNDESIETKFLPTYSVVPLGGDVSEIVLEKSTAVLQENEELKDRVEQTAEQIIQAEQQRADLAEKISALENQVSVIEDIRSSSDEKTELLQQEITKLEAQIEEFKSQPAATVQPTPEQEDSIAALEAKIRELEEAQDDPDEDSIFASLTGFEREILVETSKVPEVAMDEGTISWDFTDSRGNSYTFSKLSDDFIDEVVRLPAPQDTLSITLAGVGQGGTAETVEIRDLSKFVTGQMPKPMNELYNTVTTPGEFIFEVWWIVSQFELTSYEMQPDPKHPLDTFSKGEGDNEDLAILMADMIKSSDIGKTWELRFIYFDSDNPSTPQKINHVALLIESEQDTWLVEPTAKTIEDAFVKRDKVRGNLAPI